MGKYKDRVLRCNKRNCSICSCGKVVHLSKFRRSSSIVNNSILLWQHIDQIYNEDAKENIEILARYDAISVDNSMGVVKLGSVPGAVTKPKATKKLAEDNTSSIKLDRGFTLMAIFSNPADPIRFFKNLSEDEAKKQFASILAENPSPVYIEALKDGKILCQNAIHPSVLHAPKC